MKRIPFLLIYSRILIGIIIGVIAYFRIEDYSTWIVILMITGLLTDVFDGIIARKLNVSSEKLRIWDSNVDLFFWLITIISIFLLNIPFILENKFWILSILTLEFLAYILSYLKFKKTIATHSILAKIWTLVLLIFLIDLCINSHSYLPFIFCILLGILSRIEIIAIILSLKKWTTDVPSILVVAKINKGISFKKSKFFNS